MLKVGDVIKLEKGMKVYGMIPSKFIIGNRLFSNKLRKGLIEIEKQYNNSVDVSNNINNIAKNIVKAFEEEGVVISKEDATIFVYKNIEFPKSEIFKIESGEFIVVKTTNDGGGHGMGINDIFPDGWHIFCKRLNEDGSYDENGEEIDFYQSGSFTAMIKDIQPIRTMKMKFT